MRQVGMGAVLVCCVLCIAFSQRNSTKSQEVETSNGSLASPLLGQDYKYQQNLYELPTRKIRPGRRRRFLARDKVNTYFKVRIPPGSSMDSPSVVEKACRRARLRTVCSGVASGTTNKNFKYVGNGCVTTAQNYYSVYDIIELVCNTKSPPCSAALGVFTPYANKLFGICVKYSLDGTPYHSSWFRDCRGPVYFALCAKPN